MASARASSRRLRSSSVSVPARRLASGRSPVLLEDTAAEVDDLGVAAVAGVGRADEQVLEDGEIGEGLRDLERARDAGPRPRAVAALA